MQDLSVQDSVTVVVLRAFLFAGQVQPVGSQVDLPGALAVQLIQSQKARLPAVSNAEPEPGPPKAVPVAAPRRAKAKPDASFAQD